MVKSKPEIGLLFLFSSTKLAFFIIECWIECIEVLTVQVILHNPETFTKTLEVYNFSCTQEFNRIINIWVIFYKAKNIVVSSTCFLFRSHIFHKVSNWITGGLHCICTPWSTTCRNWVDTSCMVNIIIRKSCSLICCTVKLRVS